VTTLATSDAEILAAAFTITTVYDDGTVTTIIRINGITAASDTFVIPPPAPTIP
jgi:hypothetical protein